MPQALVLATVPSIASVNYAFNSLSALGYTKIPRSLKGARNFDFCNVLYKTKEMGEPGNYSRNVGD